MEDKTERRFAPESVMMSHGFRPEWSEGSVKNPVFLTSTFTAPTAEKIKRSFEISCGIRELDPGEAPDLIYSRLNNPGPEIFEARLAYYEEAEACAAFVSGTAAISSVFLEFLKPGDYILHSDPLYGGTDGTIKKMLTKWGVRSFGVDVSSGSDETRVRLAISRLYAGDDLGRLTMIFIETPANPTNDLFDIELFVNLARQYSSHVDGKSGIMVVVDNTFLGPVYQSPLKLGADLVIYSATKYIGGHSDFIGGACLGSKDNIERIKRMRSGSLGNMMDPFTAWLANRSLETLKIRVEKQVANAIRVADYLKLHSKVERVYYLGHIKNSDPQKIIYDKQCGAPGAMITFDIKGGEKEAFRFVNALKLIKLAVSLGSTESLISHPASSTHLGVGPERRAEMGVTDSMIRLSVGIEDPDDLIFDLENAFNAVN